MPPAIETFGLVKRFPRRPGLRQFFTSTQPDDVVAVDGVDLAVESGEVFGLVGPNGAGKTTLIKLLCTLILPTAGTARVNGYDLSDEGKIKDAVGLVTGDERSFFWRLSGRRNLEFFAALHGLSGADAACRVDAVLERVGLTAHADRAFQTYSTGMRQRLSIARGLLNQPRLLFMDEPTKGLDPPTTRRLHEFIKQDLSGRQGVTVFLTTHRLEEAEQLCDRIAIMDRGKVRACGTAAQLRAMVGATEHYRLRVSPFSERLRAALQAFDEPVTVVTLDGTEAAVEFHAADGEPTLTQVIDVLRGQDCEIKGMRVEEVPLEEVFVHVTEDNI